MRQVGDGVAVAGGVERLGRLEQQDVERYEVGCFVPLRVDQRVPEAPVEELRHPHAVFGVERGHQQRMRIAEIEQPHPDRDQREESDGIPAGLRPPHANAGLPLQATHRPAFGISIVVPLPHRPGEPPPANPARAARKPCRWYGPCRRYGPCRCGTPCGPTRQGLARTHDSRECHCLGSKQAARAFPPGPPRFPVVSVPPNLRGARRRSSLNRDHSQQGTSRITVLGTQRVTV